MVSNDYLLHNRDNTDKHRIAQGGLNSPVLASESHSNRLNERWVWSKLRGCGLKRKLLLSHTSLCDGVPSHTRSYCTPATSDPKPSSRWPQHSSWTKPLNSLRSAQRLDKQHHADWTKRINWIDCKWTDLHKWQVNNVSASFDLFTLAVWEERQNKESATDE